MWLCWLVWLLTQYGERVLLRPQVCDTYLIRHDALVGRPPTLRLLPRDQEVCSDVAETGNLTERERGVNTQPDPAPLHPDPPLVTPQSRESERNRDDMRTAIFLTSADASQVWLLGLFHASGRGLRRWRKSLSCGPASS